MTPDEHTAQRNMVLAAQHRTHQPDVYPIRRARTDRDRVRQQIRDTGSREARLAIHRAVALRPCPGCGRPGGFMWCDVCGLGDAA